MTWLRILLIAVFLTSAVAPARAEVTTYEKPSLKTIIKAMVRFGAIDVFDDEVIDIYGRVNECEIYTKHYTDVFKWEKIRNLLRDQIRQDISTYPTGFRYDTALKLDRYDFRKKIYPFAEISRQQNVNTFIMQTDPGDYCMGSELKGFPTSFKMVLDAPVMIEGLPLSEEEGEALFNRMTEAGNRTHIAYVRFNIRIVYIAALSRPTEVRLTQDQPSKVSRVRQETQSDSVVFDARLDSIDYYEDEARTKLIYRYRL